MQAQSLRCDECPQTLDNENLSKQAQEIQLLRDEINVSKGNIPDNIQHILDLRRTVSDPGFQVWEARELAPPPMLSERRLGSKLKVVTIANLKGGVGKTTITANLGAYCDLRLEKRVLLIDLDYQGSLSAMLLGSVNRTLTTSLADPLINGQITPDQLLGRAESLSPTLTRSCLVPASYTLAAEEEKLLLKWLLEIEPNDIRYNLASVLWSDEIERKFDIVLIDVGPRLTTASIQALYASSHFIVPTNLDKLAAETITSFLLRVLELKQRRSLPIELLGAVGTMTDTDTGLTDTEQDAMGDLKKAVAQWPTPVNVFKRTIPDKVAFSKPAGRNIAYCQQGDNGNRVKSVINELGDEFAKRIGFKT